MVAACVRLPSVWPNVSMIRSRSTSSMPAADQARRCRRRRGLAADAAARTGRRSSIAVGADLAAVGEQHRAMDGVLQFAHVAAPAHARRDAAQRIAVSGRNGNPFTSA